MVISTRKRASKTGALALASTGRGTTFCPTHSPMRTSAIPASRVMREAGMGTGDLGMIVFLLSGSAAGSAWPCSGSRMEAMASRRTSLG